MRLEERSYSTKILRPRPLVYLSEDGELIVVATAWGQVEHAQQALDEVVKYVSTAKEDVEVTSPFEFLSVLTDEVNYLRTSMLIANENLYRGINNSEYFSGVEMMAILKTGNQISWAHVGCPSLLIQRKNQSLQPLSVAQDLAGEINSAGDLSPLPSQLLGLEPTCYIHCGHVPVQDVDRLVLLSSSHISTALWQKEGNTLNLSTVTSGMIQENPESPFWLGLVELGSD